MDVVFDENLSYIVVEGVGDKRNFECEECVVSVEFLIWLCFVACVVCWEVGVSVSYCLCVVIDFDKLTGIEHFSD